MPVIALVAPGPDVTSTTPGLAGRARIGIGRMRGRLLVAHQNVRNFRAIEQRVINMQDGAARITKNKFDALVFERSSDHVATG